MKKGFILTVFLFLNLMAYSQDYKVQKLESGTKGEYKINRLLVISDSVPNTEINKFITDFTSALKNEFEKRELNFFCIKSATSDFDFILENFNPDGVLKFALSVASTQYLTIGQIFVLFPSSEKLV